MVTKNNIGNHGGNGNPPLDFDQAYNLCSNNPNRVYQTTGNQIPFTVIATVGQRGDHANERVLRFMSGTQERARAYACCWPFQSNCNATHINCYSEAIV
jgi:hypothetical protein